MTAQTREEVLEGLRELRDDENGEFWPSCTRLDRAIAYLERPATSENLLPLQSAEGAIEVLLQMRMDVGIPSWEAHLDLVVAYLKSDHAEAFAAEIAHNMEPPPGRPAPLKAYDLAPCMYRPTGFASDDEPDVEELELAHGQLPAHGWAYVRRDEVAALLTYISTAPHAQKEALVALDGLMGLGGEG